MNPSHKIVIGSIGLLLIVGGTTSALINRAQIVDLNTRALASARTQVELRGQIARLRLEMRQPTKRSTQSAVSPVQPTTPQKVLDRQELRARLAQDPALIALRKDFFAADAKLRLDHCVQLLGFPDDQIAALCDRMARFDEEAEHLANQLPGNIASANDPSLADYRNLSQKAQVEYESDLKLLLGSEAFEKFAEFQSQQEIWQRTDNLASALYATEPLSNFQSQQLFKILKAHATHSPGSSRAYYDLTAIAQESADFLSPLQLSILNKQLIAAKIW